jgi:hypothetical protein
MAIVLPLTYAAYRPDEVVDTYTYLILGPATATIRHQALRHNPLPFVNEDATCRREPKSESALVLNFA